MSSTMHIETILTQHKAQNSFPESAVDMLSLPPKSKPCYLGVYSCAAGCSPQATCPS